MSSVSRGPPGGIAGSGCDVWGSANRGATPSGTWGVDVASIVPVSMDSVFTSINVEETVTNIKTDVKSLVNCQDKEKQSIAVSSIAEKVDSLRKLLQMEAECHERKAEYFQKICDSVMISSLLECGIPLLRGKGAQLLYHLFKREDQASTPAYVKLKDKSIYTDLVTLVDSCEGEVAKFWGLCALEFFIRLSAAARNAFMVESDGVAILMRIKDGYSHSVDLQNATDRVLISLEKGDRGANRNFGPVYQPPPQYQQQQQQLPRYQQHHNEDRRPGTGRDFPTIGIWQPPPPPPPTVAAVAPVTSSPASSGNQPIPPSSSSAPPPPRGPTTSTTAPPRAAAGTFAIGAWCPEKP